MMLREDPNRAHRDTVAYIRSTIKAGYQNKGRYPSDIEVAKDLECLNEVHEAHIRANTAFSTINSDQTMINLIGTWARLQRIIWQMDDKYGTRN